MNIDGILTVPAKTRFTAGLIILIYFFSLSGCGGVGGSGSSGEAHYFGMHAIDDLDGDGMIDIAVSGWSFEADGWGFDPYEFVTVLLNDSVAPDVSFTVDRYLRGGDTNFEDVATGDLNDDDLPDIITENGASIFILFQDPSAAGTFFKPVKIAVGTTINDLAVADLNEDGFNDIAIAGRGRHLSVLFQDSMSPGNFLPIISLGIECTSVAIRDLNEDTLEDLAIASPDSKAVRLIFQDPDNFGTFMQPVNLSTGRRSVAVAIDDIDKDGRPDLVVGNEYESEANHPATVSIFLQDRINPGDFLAAVNYVVGCSAYELSLGDLSDDGLLDIAVVGHCNSVEVLLQDLTEIGTFLPVASYSILVSSPGSVTIGDINADTLNDLIVTDWYAGVAVRYQDPSEAGTFLQAETIYK